MDETASTRLYLLVEDRLSLTTIALLFGVVSAFPLCEVRRFTSFVLRDLVHGVLSAFLSLAVGAPLLWDVDHNSWQRRAS